MADRKKKAGTTIYLLRDVPTSVLNRAKRNTRAKGTTVKEVLIAAIEKAGEAGKPGPKAARA
jgi:hypothetical protein